MIFAMGIESEVNVVPFLWGQKNGRGVEGDDVTGPQPKPAKEKPAKQEKPPKK